MGTTAEKVKQQFVKALQKLGGRNHWPKELRQLKRDLETESLEYQLDPLARIYAQVQHLTAIFAEGATGFPVFKKYVKVVGDAEEEYMPSFPPISPLTSSYFTTWALYDLPIDHTGDTLGICQLQCVDIFPLSEQECTALKNQIDGRMGIYEHLGMDGDKVRLRELLTEREYSCHCIAGYKGNRGELWYVRLCNPLSGMSETHCTSFTTPYILTQTTKRDWEDYMTRAMATVKPIPGKDQLHCLLKYGSRVDYWHEYIMNGYVTYNQNAVFLTGIPDIKSTLPHAR